VFLNKQIEKYQKTIKQSTHRNAKHITPILKKFNMSRPPRRNITTGRLGYKTPKSHPKTVSESVGGSPDDVCPPTGDRQLSCTPATSHQAAEVGISVIKGCSLHQGFYVSTRYYWRWNCISKLTIPTFF